MKKQYLWIIGCSGLAVGVIIAAIFLLLPKKDAPANVDDGASSSSVSQTSGAETSSEDTSSEDPTEPEPSSSQEEPSSTPQPSSSTPSITSSSTPTLSNPPPVSSVAPPTPTLRTDAEVFARLKKAVEDEGLGCTVTYQDAHQIIFERGDRVFDLWSVPGKFDSEKFQARMTRPEVEVNDIFIFDASELSLVLLMFFD